MRRIPAEPSQLKERIQKYQTWFNSVQDPLRVIGTLCELEFKEGQAKLSLKQMQEIIMKGAELTAKLREELQERIREIETIKGEHLRDQEEWQNTAEKEKMNGVAELEKKLKQLIADVAEGQNEVEKLRREKTRLESLLQKQREENGKLYDKGKL